MADQDRREGEYLSLNEAREEIAAATGQSAEELAEKAEAADFPPPEEGELVDDDADSMIVSDQYNLPP